MWHSDSLRCLQYFSRDKIRLTIVKILYKEVEEVQDLIYNLISLAKKKKKKKKKRKKNGPPKCSLHAAIRAMISLQMGRITKKDNDN